MATALQCPECGHRHKLADLPDTALFRCHRCDRVLKVPESHRSPMGATTGSAPSAPASPRPRATDATVMSPKVGGNGAATRAPNMTAPPATSATTRVRAREHATMVPAAHRTGSLALPTPVRVIAWLVALPVGFIVAAIFLKLIGVLNVESAMNVFVGTGVGRFGAVVVLVPLWALGAAAIAHGLLEGAARVWPHHAEPDVDRGSGEPDR